MSDRGYYLHAPAYPSRFAVIDVGLKCTSACRHCFYSWLPLPGGVPTDDQFAGMKRAKFHSTEHLLALVDSLADHGHVGADITGGEPTLHPGIVDIVRRMTERGLAARIITLGQWLMRPMHNLNRSLLEELLDAGVADFRFSVHDVEEESMQKMTGGSWGKLRSAMDRLDAQGFQYQTNTTATADNYARLPDIARELATHQIYHANILLMMAHYAHASRPESKSIQARYSRVAPYLRTAVDILEGEGIAVTVRYAPMCTIAGLEKNLVGAVGVRYDAHEWANAINHTADPETSTLQDFTDMGRRILIEPGEPPGLTLLQVEGGIDWEDA